MSRQAEGAVGVQCAFWPGLQTSGKAAPQFKSLRNPYGQIASLPSWAHLTPYQRPPLPPRDSKMSNGSLSQYFCPLVASTALRVKCRALQSWQHPAGQSSHYPLVACDLWAFLLRVPKASPLPYSPTLQNCRGWARLPTCSWDGLVWRGVG